MSMMTFTKRQKERNRKEKQQEKEVRRAERRRENALRPKGAGPEIDTSAEAAPAGGPMQTEG